MNASDCPTDQALQRYAAGLASDQAIDDLDRHIEACDQCRDRMFSLSTESDALVRTLRQGADTPAYVNESAYQRGLELVRDIGATREFAEPQLADLIHNDASHPSRIRDYVLGRKLGEGGIGTVYEARHERLDRVVAIKVLRLEQLRNESALRRFDREIAAVGKLNHPNIVDATDAGVEDGVPFLVMERIEGIDFAAVLRRHGSLSVSDACEVIRQAALGLQHAYELGFVHRDIKPSNLFLASDGVLKVLDFGLARLRKTAEDPDLTFTGQLLGTPNYIAPEQVRDSHSADIRADIYALGCTFYALLTGRPPFDHPKYASVVEKLSAHEATPPEPLADRSPNLPAELITVIDRMLAKNPADRFARPAQIEETLRRFSGDSDLAALCSTALDNSESPILRDPRTVTPSFDAASTIDPRSTGGPTENHCTGSVPSDRRPLLRPDVLARRMTPPTRWLSALAAIIIVTIVGYSIIIRIKNEKGQVIAEVLAPAGAKIEIIPRGAAKQAVRKPQEHSVTPARPADGPHPVDWDFVAHVRTLPAQQQVEAVIRKLKELNPRMNDSFVPAEIRVIQNKFARRSSFMIEDSEVRAFAIIDQPVTDISPLRALEDLQDLAIGQVNLDLRADLVDLAPLEGLNLLTLGIANTSVSDLRPLARMPLEHLYVAHTRIADLSVVTQLPTLKVLHITSTSVEDLSPLRGSKIETLWCDRTRVSNLQPLRDSRITHLNCRNTNVSDLSPLTRTAIEVLHMDGCKVRDLSPLATTEIRALSFDRTEISDLAPLAACPLSEISFGATRVAQLSPLKDCPLSRLTIDQTNVHDLSPISGKRLTHFSCRECRIDRGLDGIVLAHAADFSSTNLSSIVFLSNTLITHLKLNGNAITDLSPLRRLPLRGLHVHDMNAYIDLSPLRGMDIEDIRFDVLLFDNQQVGLLRSFPLKSLNGQPAADFWKDIQERRRAVSKLQQGIAALPPENQLREVLNEVRRLNAGVELSAGRLVKDGELRELTLSASSWGLDISPLRALARLRVLRLTVPSGFVDLSPLNALPIEELVCDESHILRNSGILRRIDTLRTINGRPADEYWRDDAAAGRADNAP